MLPCVLEYPVLDYMCVGLKTLYTFIFMRFFTAQSDKSVVPHLILDFCPPFLFCGYKHYTTNVVEWV